MCDRPRPHRGLKLRYFITGSAGFIGAHVTRRLLAAGAEVVGYDSFSAYYDPALKEARTAWIGPHPRYRLHRAALEDRAALERAWAEAAPDVVIHLAAQAGVRYSLEAPDSYVSANLVGTFNVLEAARARPPRHLLIASTSSVFGANAATPFRETDRAVHPLSLYAATKGATELMGHSYAHLFGIATTFFRFFTVYGPWGRPDMAYFSFAKAILEGRPIDVYGHGRMSRDFTYVDDLVRALVALADAVPGSTPVGPHDTLSPVAPHRVVNIGGGAPTPLMDFIAALEQALGKTAQKRFLPMQDGDVTDTHASTALLRALTGAAPETPLAEGVAAFVDWYRGFYGT